MSINDLTDAISDPDGSGLKNVFLGYGSGVSTTTGTNNNGLGLYTLTNNTFGDYNNAVGHFVLYSNVNGFSNNAIGDSALYSNVNGSSNNAIGDVALYSNVSGTDNVAFGDTSLYYLNGGYNDGNYSGDGSNNVALGFNAGGDLQAGDYNILIGSNAQAYDTNSNYYLNIGDVIYGNLSSGHIGINVPSPTTELEVNGTISATALVVGGVSITGSGGSGDRITSGSLVAVANSATGYISLTTGATNWGYLSSGASYIPSLSSNFISTTALTVNGVSITGDGVSMSIKDLTDAISDPDDSINASVFLGYGSGVSNTTGGHNNGLGLYSLASNIDGYANNALGVNALYNNVSGGLNTAIGEGALYNLNGGYNDGNYTSGDGSNNVALGYSAGNGLSAGDYNIFIGAGTDTPTNNSNYYLNIGNVIFGDLYKGYIGINVPSPTTELEVNGTISATALVVGGVSITGSGGSSDRITSGTLLAVANSATGYISLTTGATNWGYLSSGQSYIPSLSSNFVSATTLNVSGTAYVSNLVVMSISTTAGTDPSLSISAAGSDTQVQYNSSGSFAGSSAFTYSGGLLTVTNISTTNISVSTINGIAVGSLGGTSDRIVSGSLVAVANSATGYISLTTGATNWGYLSSGASYLPNLSSNFVSSTNISATTLNVSGTAYISNLIVMGVSGSAGTDPSLTVSATSPGGASTNVQYNSGGSFGGDSGLTYTSATNILTVSGKIGVASTTPSATLDVSGSIKLGTSPATCTANDYGLMRFSGGQLQICLSR